MQTLSDFRPPSDFPTFSEPTRPSRSDCPRCEAKSIGICGVLSRPDLLELSVMAERRHLSAREVVAIQGDRADLVFNVMSGTIRLYSLLPDGRRQIVGFLQPGDFLGLSLQESSLFCADAVVDTTVCCFQRVEFRDLLDRKPHLMRRFHEAAAQEMTAAQRHLVLLGKARAEVRVLSFLLQMRERRSAVCGRTSVTVPLPMSRQDIADYLGLTISTVSRTLTRLERNRMILIVPDGVRLLDLPAIEEAVCGG